MANNDCDRCATLENEADDLCRELTAHKRLLGDLRGVLHGTAHPAEDRLSQLERLLPSDGAPAFGDITGDVFYTEADYRGLKAECDEAKAAWTHCDDERSECARLLADEREHGDRLYQALLTHVGWKPSVNLLLLGHQVRRGEP